MWRQTGLLQNFSISFCQLCGSAPATYGSRCYLSTPSRARCGLFTSDQLHSHSRQKVEVAELEQASYTVSSLSNCAKTDAKISDDYSPLFHNMEFNDCVYVKFKTVSRNLKVSIICRYIFLRIELKSHFARTKFSDSLRGIGTGSTISNALY